METERKRQISDYLSIDKYRDQEGTAETEYVIDENNMIVGVKCYDFDGHINAEICFARKHKNYASYVLYIEDTNNGNTNVYVYNFAEEPEECLKTILRTQDAVSPFEDGYLNNIGKRYKGDMDTEIREVLKEAVSYEYVDYILDVILEEAKEDIETSADENYNDIDIKYALGRVICKHLNINV